jgi:tetratricopeptide (TPR) repeat protein
LSVVAELPDGSRVPLISIEHFDENWHDCYRYRQPVRLRRGARLVSTFTYDNTEANPRNRNHPPRRVVYGSNAEDEMADVYLQITAVHADQRAVLMENYKRYEMQSQIVGFRKSLEMYPENPWIQEGLASYLFGSGQMDEAIRVLEDRIKSGPVAVFPMVGFGMALVAKNELARAEEQFRQAISMDGDYPLAWLGLGKALSAQQKFEPAEDAYRRGLELAPGLSDARLGLADLLMRRGQLDDAKEVYAAAIDDSPEAANIYLKLAEISAKQGRFDECLEYCSKARQLAPYTHPPKVLLAVNCFQIGDTEKARSLLSEARLESPDHPMPSLMLGQLARRERQLEAARNYFLAAAQKVPENWPDSHRQRFLVSLHSERFQLAQQLQDLDLARDALAEWLKCDPQNDQLQRMYDELRDMAAPK